MSFKYCSYVMIHTSGYPRRPLGPNDPVVANDAVCVYVRYKDWLAYDEVIANDPVYNEPDPNGYTLNTDYPSNA